MFRSLHHSDRIFGYIATQYEKAEQFAVAEHYISWCDAVANGLDIVIKKYNTEYIRQKLEERNMTDIYTGLMSRKGFVRKLETGAVVAVFSFPQRCGNTQYFVTIVSAALRSADLFAVYPGENAFAAIMKDESADVLAEKLCGYLSELGIYITTKEIDVTQEAITDTDTAGEQLDRMFYRLAEKNMPKTTRRIQRCFQRCARK